MVTTCETHYALRIETFAQNTTCETYTMVTPPHTTTRAFTRCTFRSTFLDWPEQNAEKQTSDLTIYLTG